MSAILLVTGSRACADTPAATQWARGILRPAILAQYGGGYLVVGDAAGPDTWAREIAQRAGVPGRSYQLDGRILLWERDVGTYVDWDPASDEGRRRHGSRWPLIRNEAEVAFAAKRAGAGVTMHVVALVAPWSRTRGTEHTGRLAERSGLAVEWHNCPASLGPARAGLR